MAEVELPNPEEIREHGRDRFGRGVALVTALFAVMLALAALGGNHAMKEMLLAQQKASDQWAFYQAKVIREHQYRGQKLRLEADLVERGDAMKPAARERIEGLMKQFEEEEKRYNVEKKDIEQEAKRLEHERDVWQTKDPYFLFAEAVLQISIVMASVSILSRSGIIFSFSLVLAAAGALLTVNGFLLIVQLPYMLGGH
ncbi:MAG TPA: DUF4337 domain-containing protein [Candidatus Methylomirabilis sp.]|nr:DUF4337 domain-containing protein [Candidatus Methylomirabilis sp.]